MEKEGIVIISPKLFTLCCRSSTWNHMSNSNHMKICIKLLCLFLLSCQVCFADPATFITVADIHFNPFASCRTKPCALALSLQQAPVSQWQTLFEKDASKELSDYDYDTNY